MEKTIAIRNNVVTFTIWDLGGGFFLGGGVWLETKLNPPQS